MKVYCETFGCTMNRGDSELMLGCLKAIGHEPTTKLEDADLLIINTCAVEGPTQRRVLRRLGELRKLNGKQIVVAGCLPLIDLSSIERLGTFAGIVSCHSISSIPVVVERIARGETDVRALGREPYEKPCLPKLRSSGVSAIVAISEGCTSSCSYCSVRLARGRLHNFSARSILSEIEDAVGRGYREILLTSQDTAAYGIDLGTGLPELLESYESDKIYKFLHLPVQSGDDGVLAAMRRGYTAREFVEIVEAFRERFEDLYLTTDIIVGFLGEGEREFMRTCELIEEIRPDNVNLTRFSPMPGTDAAKMRQVDGREVKRRSKMLSARCKEIGYEQNKRYIGRVMEGLVVEEGEKGGYVVRLPNYKPAIIRDGKIGDFVTITVTDAHPTYLLGEALR